MKSPCSKPAITWAAIRRIIEHMYATLEASHFIVSEKVGAGGTVFLV